MSVALLDTAIPAVNIVLRLEVFDESNGELALVVGKVGEELNFVEVFGHHGYLLFKKYLYFSAVVSLPLVPGGRKE
jgi:hypothetical protein